MNFWILEIEFLKLEIQWILIVYFICFNSMNSFGYTYNIYTLIH